MRRLLAIAGSTAGLAGLAAAAPLAAEADVRTLDRKTEFVDALRGVAVWPREARGRTTLVRLIAGRVSRIPGVRPMRGLGGFDLGLDRRGRVVVVYARCRSNGNRCRGPFVSDVRRGGERRLRLRRRRGCSPPTVGAIWGSRVAYRLACRHSRHSGVYVTRRGGAARRVLRLVPGALDLGPRTLVASDEAAVWVASTRGRPCQRRIAEPDTPPGVEYRAVQIAAGRAWWLHEVVGDYGGGDILLAGAAIGSDCSITTLERPRDLNEIIFEPWSYAFALDGPMLYLGLPFGSGVVSVPLAELPQR